MNCLLLDLGEDLRVAEEEVLLHRHKIHSSALPSLIRKNAQTHLVTELDRVAAPAREEYAVARLHLRRDDLARLVGRTGARRDDGRLGERRRGRRRGEEDARGSFLMRGV